MACCCKKNSRHVSTGAWDNPNLLLAPIEETSSARGRQVKKCGVYTHGERAEREPITRVWGLSPQRGPGAEPLVRGSGGEAPEAKLKTFWLLVLNGSCKFASFSVVCKLPKPHVYPLIQLQCIGCARGNHCRVSNIFFNLSSRLVGKLQDGLFEVNVRKRRVSQAPNHDRLPNPSFSRVKTHLVLHQCQERPLAKVGWPVPPPVHSVATPLIESLQSPSRDVTTSSQSRLTIGRVGENE